MCWYTTGAHERPPGWAMKPLLEIMRQSEDYLAKHQVASPRVAAEWLIGHALKLNRVQLYVQFDRPLAEAELASIRALLKRSARGEPVQYITGECSFHAIELQVGPGVLIPRPETEELVDLALTLWRPEEPVLDLCTGSGAIILALAKARPKATQLTGVDLSSEALTWAQRNRDILGLTQVELRAGDLCAPVLGRQFQLITANPPYVSEQEYAELSPLVRDHEPRLALLSGPAGLDLLQRLAIEAPACLQAEGHLLAEIGAGQGPAVATLFARHGWREVVIKRDLSSRDRFLVARRPQVAP